jgi:protein phosphatase methylesterase 1
LALIYYTQDDPIRLAGILADFWRRNEQVVVGVKKVGDS